MDRIEAYKKIIQDCLMEEADKPINPNYAVPCVFVQDQLADRFILLAKGWLKKRYVHYFIYHIEIIDEKIWIHEDRTDTGIALALVERGIPKSAIILGYLPNYARALSEFGVLEA